MAACLVERHHSGTKETNRFIHKYMRSTAPRSLAQCEWEWQLKFVRHSEKMLISIWRMTQERQENNGNHISILFIFIQRAFVSSSSSSYEFPRAFVSSSSFFVVVVVATVRFCMSTDEIQENRYVTLNHVNVTTPHKTTMHPQSSRLVAAPSK